MGSNRSCGKDPFNGQMPAARAFIDPAISEQKKQQLAQLRHYAKQLQNHNLAQENEIVQAMLRIRETQARTQMICDSIERVNTAWRHVHQKSRQVTDKLTLAIDKYTGRMRDIIAENHQKEALANEKRSHDLALSKDTTDGTDSREASEKLRAENAAMANRIREADAAIAAIDSLVAKKHFLQHQLQQKYVEQQLQLQQQQDAAEPPTRKNEHSADRPSSTNYSPKPKRNRKQ